MGSNGHGYYYRLSLEKKNCRGENIRADSNFIETKKNNWDFHMTKK